MSELTNGSTHMEMAEHIEFDHERELPLGTEPAEVWRIHDSMHRHGDHWNHTHAKNGTVLWKPMREHTCKHCGAVIEFGSVADPVTFESLEGWVDNEQLSVFCGGPAAVVYCGQRHEPDENG